MTANAWVQFDIFQTTLGTAGQSLNADDTIKMALILSTWTPNTATDVTFSTIAGSYEHAAANGYSANGATTVSGWTTSAGTTKLDVADVTWTATDDGITARYALLYNASAGGTNDLIAYSLLDNTAGGTDVTAAAGVDFKVNIHASGVLTLA